MNRLKTVILILILMLCMTSSAYAEPYDISTYKADIAASENASFIVNARFIMTPSANGQELVFSIPEGECQVSDINVEGLTYKTEEEDRNVNVKMTVPDSRIGKETSVNISYRMDFYKEKDEAKDMLKLNLIPESIHGAISEAEVTISMPKKFDKSSILLNTFGAGSTAMAKVDSKTDGNLITVSCSGLHPYEGLELKCDLKQGYWKNPLNYDFVRYILIGIFTIFSLIVITLWTLYGRKERSSNQEKVTPPKGIMCAEAGYIIDGIVDHKDIVSILFHLLEKGYVKYEDGKIHKVVDIPKEEKDFIKTFYHGLFANNDSFDPATTNYELSMAYLKSKKQLLSYYNKRDRRLYTRGSAALRVFSYILAMLCPIAAVAALVLLEADKTYIYYAIPVALLMIIGECLYARAVARKHSISAKKRRKQQLAGIIAVFAACAIAGVLIWKSCGTGYLLGVFVSTYLCFIPGTKLRRRTDRSYELYDDLICLRNFIRSSDYNRLKLLEGKEENYFLTILPYAYVMGSFDKWLKNYSKVDKKITADSLYLKEICNQIAGNIVTVLPESVVKRKSYDRFGGRKGK